MTTPLLKVSNISKTFVDPSIFLGNTSFYAIKNISFELEEKKTLAIIGKNGSGKSTIAKVLVGLFPPNTGEIRFKGRTLTFGDYYYRAKHLRMVFQNPDSVFNARLNVGQILDEPLKIITAMDTEERDEKIGETLRLVGLYPDHANVRLSTMSSSQKQRVALARALILKPEIIIIDDTLATLDATVKIQMMNLLLKIQKRLGISYVYIGQNLGIVKHISDKVLVMDQGEMVEYGDTRKVFTDPQADVTKRLIESEFGKPLTEAAWYEPSEE
ncbi:peptide ABC transporter ATP-binding protein [Actinobacillus delphinicola]|uniref:peptide ABC transporter ATP-binding protein n=1 Tax=Actinobacillus delphinicola TaxID=51161 RepID=UPI00244273AA|nr:ATP-binding cassette domain-containing protein [Actinobacillus delphinicola]MDG6897384.1 peptide ABC transporter ATP-binding protein [Actinobacillus delphinicola]